jgi:hypothetical protein
VETNFQTNRADETTDFKKEKSRNLSELLGKNHGGGGGGVLIILFGSK